MRSLLKVAVVLAAFGLLTDCKRQQAGPAGTPAVSRSASPTDGAVETAPSAPATAAASDNAEVVITVRAVIAALPTQYSASFAAQRKLQHIVEERAAMGHEAAGRYEFYGARLVRYSGEQLHDTRSVDLQFDLQGAVLSNTAGLSAADLDAIKTRAQLLRSHALAQLAARSHANY